MKEAIKQRFLAELSRSSEDTQKGHLAVCQKFLNFAGGRSLSQWNGSLVNEFLDQLKAEGYAPGTIRKAYSIVKRVFDSAKAVHEAERIRLISEANPDDPGAVAEILKALSLPGPTWDLGKRARPRVDSEDVVKLAATFEELEAMIAAAKNGSLPPGASPYLALSSIYGLRREELCRVAREHLNFDEKTIYVLTAKGGERRRQLLCNEIIPYLAEYDFKKQYSPWKMSELYRIISAKAGIELKDGSGWHGPRYYLVSALVDLFGELHAHIFLRWKISSSSAMVERYYSVDPLQIDRRILGGGHPLVPLWG